MAEAFHEGQEVRDSVTGEECVIINSGCSWQEVQFNNGNIEELPSWRVG